jgi:hypothetical protein
VVPTAAAQGLVFIVGLLGVDDKRGATWSSRGSIHKFALMCVLILDAVAVWVVDMTCALNLCSLRRRARHKDMCRIMQKLESSFLLR